MGIVGLPCGQPVEKTSSSALVNVATDVADAFEPHNANASNALGQCFDNKRPTEFENELKDHFKDWHPGIVALPRTVVKEGNLMPTVDSLLRRKLGPFARHA